MTLRAIHLIQHDGASIQPGDLFNLKNLDEADRLIGLGAAKSTDETYEVGTGAPIAAKPPKVKAEKEPSAKPPKVKAEKEAAENTGPAVTGDPTASED